jgi:hypothetical protein
LFADCAGSAGPRLVNDDGTPTAWWAFITIVAPALVVLSIIALAIVRQ